MPSPAVMVSQVFEALAELVSPSRCAACDVPIPSRVAFCPTCVVSVTRSACGGADRAVFSYGGALADAVRRMKYQGRSDLAYRLGRLMASAAKDLAGTVDAVVSVPLHPRRLVERGFDQAALMAREVARSVERPWLPRALARSRDTPRQATLAKGARAANVTAAFSVRQPKRVAGLRLLLIDDVRTTGATLNACREVLRDARAREVVTLVLAHRDWI